MVGTGKRGHDGEEHRRCNVPNTAYTVLCEPGAVKCSLPALRWVSQAARPQRGQGTLLFDREGIAKLRCDGCYLS